MIREHWWLVFGDDHGFGCWMPEWMKAGIVRTWNRTVCLVVGHDEILCGIVSDPRCPHCCRPLDT